MKYLIVFFILVLPCMADAEQGRKSSVEIGDPKELFLTKVPKQTVATKHEDPKSMDEFISSLKSDFGKLEKGLRNLKKDLDQKERNSYQDPDFIQPERPDWR